MSVSYVSAKETAVVVRAALKKAFPDTKFSVRKGTGTAASWIDISWVDGPTDSAVSEVTDRYENGTIDGKLYLCAGILTHREISAEARKAALNFLAKRNRTVAIIDGNGEANERLNSDFVPFLYSDDFRIGNADTVQEAVSMIVRQATNPVELASL